MAGHKCCAISTRRCAAVASFHRRRSKRLRRRPGHVKCRRQRRQRGQHRPRLSTGPRPSRKRTPVQPMPAHRPNRNTAAGRHRPRVPLEDRKAVLIVFNRSGIVWNRCETTGHHPISTDPRPNRIQPPIHSSLAHRLNRITAAGRHRRLIPSKDRRAGQAVQIHCGILCTRPTIKPLRCDGAERRRTSRGRTPAPADRQGQGPKRICLGRSATLWTAAGRRHWPSRQRAMRCSSGCETVPGADWTNLIRRQSESRCLSGPSTAMVIRTVTGRSRDGCSPPRGVVLIWHTVPVRDRAAVEGRAAVRDPVRQRSLGYTAG
jgi:hypothetical protein